MIISEELLIDFWELSGEHSGENMAEAVWETLKQYDLVGCVSSFDIMIAAKLRVKMSATDHCICDGQCHEQ